MLRLASLKRLRAAALELKVPSAGFRADEHITRIARGLRADDDTRKRNQALQRHLAEQREVQAKHLAEAKTKLFAHVTMTLYTCYRQSRSAYKYNTQHTFKI